MQISCHCNVIGHGSPQSFLFLVKGTPELLTMPFINFFFSSYTPSFTMLGADFDTAYCGIVDVPSQCPGVCTIYSVIVL